MDKPQDVWEEIDTSRRSVSRPGNTTPVIRPGATLCSACDVITEYKDMERIGNRWICTPCADRRRSLHLM